MANTSLMYQTNFSEIEKMGFTKSEDGSGDIRGNEWTYGNDKFSICIDAWMDVTMCRKNPDTDYIKIQVDDLFDLRMLINFID